MIKPLTFLCDAPSIGLGSFSMIALTWVWRYRGFARVQVLRFCYSIQGQVIR